MNKVPELTKAEYDIMRILWKHGEKSVREICDLLRDTQGWALTTVRTMMDRMTNKGLLQKENFHGVFICADCSIGAKSVENRAINIVTFNIKVFIVI